LKARHAIRAAETFRTRLLPTTRPRAGFIASLYNIALRDITVGQDVVALV
jgi:hypothetical protein